ncbi:MAG TPA: 30S ribosomal protein S9 [Patescibacteria group bacterium]|nr:30S ribosomal protein S9 [Patescibacteria group bacterium]
MVKKATVKYYQAIGRRKSSIARVRFYIVGAQKEVMMQTIKMKQGEMYVNEKPIGEYFSGEVSKNLYMYPLRLVSAEDRFAVSIHVSGGGQSGQLSAVVLGLSRCLEKVNEEYRPLLKKEGLLTRDARIKERRKVGTGGKARRKKQSPKR